MNVKRCVIVANGSFRLSRDFRAKLEGADIVVACDGAINRLFGKGIEPDYVIGDGDSIDADLRKRLEKRFICDCNQENNDLDKAFSLALKLGASSVVILGAGGGREDHTIGNVFRLVDFAERLGCNVEMETQYGRFAPVLKEGTFACKKGCGVSVFAPEPNTKVCSEGLAWQLNGQNLPSLYSATLNRSTSDTITIKCDSPVIVFISNR